MLQVKQLIQAIESIAPPSHQESYDNAGLITGQYDQNVQAALLCLDATEAIVQEAIERNCQIIIAHHPIVFTGLKRFNGSNYVEKAIIKALQHNIAIYAAHTNLDNVYHQGVNAKIAQKLQLKQTRILAPKSGHLRKLISFVPTSHSQQVLQALFQAGAGQIGNYDQASFRHTGIGSFRPLDQAQPFSGQKNQWNQVQEERIEVLFSQEQQNSVLQALRNSHPYEEIAYDLIQILNPDPYLGSGLIGELEQAIELQSFLALVKQTFHCPLLKYTPCQQNKVQRIALCGGAGSFLRFKAKQAKADVFLSSDFKYHEFFDAENQIALVDIGHYETEQFTYEIFYDLIREKFPNFAVYQTSINTNPVAYL